MVYLSIMTLPKPVVKIIKPCIVCKKSLRSLFPEKLDENSDGYIQPMSAVNFFGAGTYGSDFDLSPEYVVNVCDDCLKDLIKEGHVLVHRVEEKATHTFTDAAE